MLVLLRSRCALVAAIALCCSLAGLPDQSQAGIFLDLNFDGDVVGNPIPTSFPSVDPIPIHRAYATNGFPDVGPYNGSTTVVSSIGGMTNAALMSTSQAGTGANYIDTQFLVSGDQISLSFDLRIVTQNNDIYPQAGLTDGAANHGQLFVIQAFALDSNRVFRFVVAPTSSSGGVLAMRDNLAGDLIPIGNYAVGTDYHVSILADYLTKTVDASVSGVGSLLVPFVSSAPTTVGMSEFFIFQNNNSSPNGNLNQVALDNIVGATLDAPVPEPSTMVIFAIGTVCCAGFARRRRGSTTVAL